jgi:phosphatidylserine/phosphatidylglycerophosphate/cardiolipin synthase-like enzyme
LTFAKSNHSAGRNWVIKQSLRVWIFCLVFALLLLAGCELDPTASPAATPPPGSEPQPIAVYFTEPRTGPGSRELEQAVLASIQGAQDSIDVVMYNFSLLSAADELVEAARRDVLVRVVLDSDALDSAIVPRLRSAGIEVIGDGRESLMHNKFLIIDGQAVWTGSLNLTASGLNNDNNNMVRVQSAEMAGLYTAEFNEMFIDEKFGDRSPTSGANGQDWLSVDGAQVQVLFSPDDRPARRLVELINQAEKSINFLAFTLTHNGMRDALLDANAGGVRVRGVFDAEQTYAAGSDYDSLRTSGVDVRLDATLGLMHAKVIILDEETVIMGSYNFTRSAEENNDENILIIRDADVARLFLEEFERIYSAAK